MKKFATALGITLTLFTIPLSLSQTAKAVQLRDGKTYFTSPPSLVDASTTTNTTRVWSATYYFTINIPTNAGEPLQRITFKQQEGGDTVKFNLSDTRAFEGERSQDGKPLNIKEVIQEPESNTVSLTFDPPISGGKIITVGLRPYNNPQYSGVYLFGVTVFPAGANPYGQFLGFGRLHFYDSGFSRGRF